MRKCTAAHLMRNHDVVSGQGTKYLGATICLEPLKSLKIKAFLETVPQRTLTVREETVFRNNAEIRRFERFYGVSEGT